MLELAVRKEKRHAENFRGNRAWRPLRGGEGGGSARIEGGKATERRGRGPREGAERGDGGGGEQKEKSSASVTMAGPGGEGNPGARGGVRRRGAGLSAAAWALVALGAAAGGRALDFEMAFATKCVAEEVEAGQLMVGEWAALERDGGAEAGPFKSVKVEGPPGQGILYDQRDSASGKFVLTAKEAGDYKACFTAQSLTIARATLISLDWKVGAAAADWDGIAKREHLDRVGIDMKKLQELTKEIHEEMLLMRKRESEMRDLNEATNTRVAWLSVGSLIVCIGTAVGQGFYLKKFFKSRKIV